MMHLLENIAGWWFQQFWCLSAAGCQHVLALVSKRKSQRTDLQNNYSIWDVIRLSSWFFFLYFIHLIQKIHDFNSSSWFINLGIFMNISLFSVAVWQFSFTTWRSQMISFDPISLAINVRQPLKLYELIWKTTKTPSEDENLKRICGILMYSVFLREDEDVNLVEHN